MLNKLKDILNTYSDVELEDIDLWVNSSLKIESIIIEEYNINLISDEARIVINDVVDKEGKINEDTKD